MPARAVFQEPAVVHATDKVGGGTSHAYIIAAKDANWKPATGMA